MTTKRIPVIRVKEVEQQGKYRLSIVFSDGTRKVVDFEGFLRRSKHPAVRRYLNANLFSKYSLDHGYLSWNNFDLVFPIMNLYVGKIE